MSFFPQSKFLSPLSLSLSLSLNKMSVLDRFPHSTAELKRVKTVQFGVLSPDEIVSLLVFLSLKEMIWRENRVIIIGRQIDDFKARFFLFLSSCRGVFSRSSSRVDRSLARYALARRYRNARKKISYAWLLFCAWKHS